MGPGGVDKGGRVEVRSVFRTVDGKENIVDRLPESEGVGWNWGTWGTAVRVWPRKLKNNPLYQGMFETGM